MMQISTPNAAYKIGSLVKKGYVEKDPVHHRPARVSPAPNPEVYRLLQHQLFLPAPVVERAQEERFSPEDCAKLEEMPTIENRNDAGHFEIHKKGGKQTEKRERGTRGLKGRGYLFYFFLIF